MQRLFTKPTNIFILFVLLLTACTKTTLEQPTPIPPVQQPGDTTTMQTGSIRFTAATDLSGQPYHSSNLQAVVTLVNESGEEVMKEQVLTLTLPSPVKTAVLQLPAGNYKLTRFRLVYGSVNTHFAAPLTGSVKAAQVQHALMLNVKVEAGKSIEFPVEVLRVQAGEQPQAFGYPSGAFDNGQADASPYLKVKLQAIMKVGDVVYDHIPASLSITTWNAQGETTTTYGALAAGVNEVNVLKAATKFQFVVSKWGTNDTITLNRQDVDENTIYTLGGSKETKKLKSERVYKIMEGKDVADTKTDYHYDYKGNLLKIDYWMRRADNTPYLAMADWFDYDANRVRKIRRVNVENNSPLKTTSFEYDLQGRVNEVNEEENGWSTKATVTYLPQQQSMAVVYDLPSGHRLNYTIELDKGNTLHTTASNSNGSFEEGRYNYDQSINPYRHMNWPDLFFSRTSKNNVTSQQNQYTGAIPMGDPFSMIYKYDLDGYPVEVVKNYRSPQTGNYLFSTKTIFVY